MMTKEELADIIAALESQPHLSLKEEKYLAVCRELHRIFNIEPVTPEHCYYENVYRGGAEHDWAKGFNDGLSFVKTGDY